MNKKANIFKFKSFEIHQDQNVFKVGTDACLLGAWVCQHLNTVNQALDIGCGTGILSHFLAHSFPQSQIAALDLNLAAVKLCRKNAEINQWSNRIRCYHTSFQEFQAHSSVDLIICNPPYFIGSLKNKLDHQTKARHQDQSFSWNQLFNFSKTALNPSGKLALIFPFEQLRAVRDMAVNQQFYLQRLCTVKGTSEGPIKRALCLFSKTNTPSIEEHLVIEKSRHEYTPQAYKLLQPYYLKL